DDADVERRAALRLARAVRAVIPAREDVPRGEAAGVRVRPGRLPLLELARVHVDTARRVHQLVAVAGALRVLELGAGRHDHVPALHRPAERRAERAQALVLVAAQ